MTLARPRDVGLLRYMLLNIFVCAFVLYICCAASCALCNAIHVQCALCNVMHVQCALCNMHCAMSCALCIVQCHVQCAMCIVQCHVAGVTVLEHESLCTDNYGGVFSIDAWAE